MQTSRSTRTAAADHVTVHPALDLNGGPYLLGIIGDPVAHSLSPVLHQPALDDLGIPATYERWHTPAGELVARIERLRKPGTLGANVTVPHKVAVLNLIDDASPAAQRAGAVNTILNRDGRLIGDNTDIYGFQAALADLLTSDGPGKALVLGAGGAARAVVLALESLGVEEVVVANRDADRAMRLATDLAPAPVRGGRLDDELLKEELPSTALLVNATSLGWHAGETPIDVRYLDLLPENAVIADLTYRDTDLLLAATARLRRTIDGLPMLVHQGARAFELFTGYPAPLAIMHEAARRARQAA
jgi:shikimate dehydrogenase